MFSKTAQDLPFPDRQLRQLRYALAIRIAMVLLAFFSAAWALLQWSLSTEPRFMVDGIARQFVMVEAMACAFFAVMALAIMVANAFCWLATFLQMRREQRSVARGLAMQRTAQRIAAYI